MGGTLSKGHSGVGSIIGVMDTGQWQDAGIIVGLDNLHNFLSYFLFFFFFSLTWISGPACAHLD